MRIRQYACFGISTRRYQPHEVTAALGIEPDRVRQMGSRSTAPVLPTTHRWQVDCRDAELRLDEQVDRLLDRLEPATDRIAEFLAAVARTEGHDWRLGGTLSLVRHLDDADGEEDDALERAEDAAQRGEMPLLRLPGQHQLLGWHLDLRAIDFLHRTRVELDVDEYG